VSERSERTDDGATAREPGADAVGGRSPLRNSRVRPTPSPTTRPFWDATAEGRFLIQRCPRCTAAQFYPKATCTTCGSAELEWEDASGEATVHTFTVARRPTHPAFSGDEPYVIAILELAEGPRVTGNVVGCDVDDVHVTMPVRLDWDEPDENGIRLPRWRPA
jgi:uncharacterized OB-fold protein